jgi:hypothetical protein
MAQLQSFEHELADTLHCPTQTALEDMHSSMLPLLQAVNTERSLGAELFRHESDIGSLALNDTGASLLLRVSEPLRKTPEGFDIQPIRVEMKYVKWLDDRIEPEPLFSPLAFVVFMQASSTPFSQRYIPFRWPDGGTSIHTDRHEALAPRDILRVQRFLGKALNDVMGGDQAA